MVYSDLTVIIPCYNAEKSIERCISSIVTQSLLPKRVIVVNDCSIDSTLSILNSMKSKRFDFDFDIINLNENKGPSYARNIAWNKCTTAYIAFLDSDDAWHKDKIFYQYNFMTQNPNIVMTGHDFEIKSYGSLAPVNFDKITLNQLIFKNYFFTPGVMLKNIIGLRFDESKKYSEDYKLWLNITADYPNLVYYTSAKLGLLFKPSFGVSGLSSKLVLMQKGEIECFKYLFMYGYLGRPYYFLAIAFSFLKFFRRLLITFIRKIYKYD
ncbi:glycosyltransferase family 2 protein [Acinetobacter indicus]|uniref:glycosyltransferase family 2 protein n=1 Tax=Acinetobacter indicus TaxID=756892 RepID=UPI000CEC9D30|nr:glycosyltransferase family 2 protein [Acinetobacter indicus]